MEFDPDKYDNIIQVCALLSDLDQMADGHNTFIGEKGINLSGGQKARICLARALYSDADVYLLDDPLSAVDTKVGEQLFNEAIGTYLEGKTIILNTHQLHFALECDEIIVLEEGKVVIKDTYENICEKRPDIFH